MMHKVEWNKGQNKMLRLKSWSKNVENIKDLKKNLGQPTAFISAYSGGKVKENGMYVASDQTVIQFKKKCIMPQVQEPS